MKFLFALFLLSATLPCLAQNADALKYLKDNVTAIDTGNTANDIKTFDFLKTQLEGKRIIAMGEATHGTHEFQATKVRIFKYLVTQMHYKLFGIEANFTKCRKVNDYVLHGKGDAKRAIAGMAFWMWNTKEVLGLVEWMRSYNETKPENEKVKFYGFDMQYDAYIIPRLTANLKKLDSTYFNAHFSRLKLMNVSRAKLNDQQKDSLKTLLQDLSTYVDSKQAELATALSKDEAAYTKHDIRLLQQCLELNEAANKSFNRMAAVNQTRDKNMCENIRWILDYEGADSKIALWAHNLHISKAETSRGAMGAYLKKEFKDNYYALGFDFNKGAFRAGDMQARKINTFTFTGADPGSTGQLLSGVGLPEFFIDINKAKENPALKKLLGQDLPHWAVGDTFSSEKISYLKDTLSDMYDGLIFVNETTGSLPIN